MIAKKKYCAFRKVQDCLLRAITSVVLNFMKRIVYHLWNTVQFLLHTESYKCTLWPLQIFQQNELLDDHLKPPYFKPFLSKKKLPEEMSLEPFRFLPVWAIWRRRGMKCMCLPSLGSECKRASSYPRKENSNISMEAPRLSRI